MLDRSALLSDLQKLLVKLEADLLERSASADVPEVGQTLRAEFARAQSAERTAQNYEDWRSDAITQHAAAWVLSAVFVRFLEDNRLIEPPRIAGPGERLQRARDEHELYFRQHPKETDRDFLLHSFDELAGLPGTRDVFGGHNPLRELPNWLSGDAAGELLKFFQKIDANTGALVHDFTSCQSSVVSRQWEKAGSGSRGSASSSTTDHGPRTTDDTLDTRFLGDLYQDLSEAARKKYALLQTPEFVEEFILDRTLEPAIEEFGLRVHRGDAEHAEERGSESGSRQEEDDEVLSSSTSQLLRAPRSPRLRGEIFFRMIDPACGSGHFLLGAFRRILDRWQRLEPGTNVRVLVQRTLDSIHGVDVNPYAIAIARFRLLLAALRACGISRLADAPAFRLNLVCGDSLLHGAGEQQSFGWADVDHAAYAEDLAELRRILVPSRYHAVVANPPYITPKDRALNQAYRERYRSCHMKYSLSVPFLERIFRLAVPSGYTGQITSNSFMKREFGRKLIEEFLPTVDLTHVIDTSGAYIPGHGTPTVILFGRHRKPVAGVLRTVMGIRGEPGTPDNPALGLVWSSIVDQINLPGSQSNFVSVTDSIRDTFHKHPWSIGGGGAAELKEQMDDVAQTTLNSKSTSIGITSFTLEDDIYLLPRRSAMRSKLRQSDYRTMVVGDVVRDWIRAECDVALFPYDELLRPIAEDKNSPSQRYLWPARTCLSNNKMFGGRTKVECGLKWYEYGRLTADKLRTPLSVVFAFVGTHNHFVLDCGGNVFKQSAPIIKLRADAQKEEYLGLLGLLNSSTACFWMKQVFHNKGAGGGTRVASGRSPMGDETWESHFEFDGTKLNLFPLTEPWPQMLGRRLDELAHVLDETRPPRLLAASAARKSGTDECLVSAVEQGRQLWEQTRSEMIAAQEELDWECYRLYGMLDADLTLPEPPPLQLGQRAFEIVLARKLAAGETQTTWFARHGSTPITELPADWPADYRRLVERRIELIETDPHIRLIEQPEYKRRWNTEPWESQLERALREWLLDRLESYFDFDGRMRPDEEDSPRRRGARGDRNEEEERQDVGKEEAIESVKHHSETSPPASALSAAPRLSSSPSGCAFPEPALVSLAKLADVARNDPQFQEVGALYRDDPAFDVQRLVEELVAAESVPLLPVLRYKDSGLRKRLEWERTWELQREEDRRAEEDSPRRRGVRGDRKEEKERQELVEEDAIESVKHPSETSPPASALSAAPRLTSAPVPIPVPPKYTSADFLKSDFWRLRGKLDVPKERWVSFPHCDGPDGTAMIAWAGYDHLQLAQAISAYYVDVQERYGGRDDPRLPPLLAGLAELIPWLKQWHNAPDPNFGGQQMGDYFEGFVQDEARQMGLTVAEVKAWTPPAKVSKGRKKKNS